MCIIHVTNLGFRSIFDAKPEIIAYDGELRTHKGLPRLCLNLIVIFQKRENPLRLTKICGRDAIDSTINRAHDRDG